MGRCVDFLDGTCGMWHWGEVFLSCYLGVGECTYKVSGTDFLFAAGDFTFYKKIVTR
jgi:hypothetical protein